MFSSAFFFSTKEFRIELCYIYIFDFIFVSMEQQMNKLSYINPDVQRQTIENLLTEPGAAVEKCLKPEFLHLAPPLHSAVDEVCAQFIRSLTVSIGNLN